MFGQMSKSVRTIGKLSTVAARGFAVLFVAAFFFQVSLR